MNLDDFKRLQRLVNDRKVSNAKAEGVLEKLIKELEEEYGHKDVNAARKAVKEMSDRLHTAINRFNRNLRKVKEKWKDVL